ncbi:helix-turn-helix transcriptional regulator [Candidatus Gottesmanbacteria bacterium]|nr:helix-turn-helix transcriptional regulator [Candidatus Gottesmanbacteria bacterium]
MKRRHINFVSWKKQALKNPKFKTEYDRLQPEFALIRAVIEARINKGLTQTELAEKIGTKQSVISRLEIGKANPSFSFLKRLAQALNTRLEIRFTSS